MKPNALDQAAALQGWDLPEGFQHLRHLLEARMGNRGKREFIQVLRLMEAAPKEIVAGAVNDAIRDCQESCVRGRVAHHALTNLSSNMMANWVFASHHSRGGIFHVRATWRKTRNSNLIAASSVGK